MLLQSSSIVSLWRPVAFVLACWVAGPLMAQSGAGVASTASLDPAEILLRRVPYFSQDKQPIADVMQALGRSYGISVLCEKGLEADVQVEFHNMSLQGILDAICDNEGFYWNLEDAGYVSVRRFKTVIYLIEYPQVERKGSTKSSINLGQTGYKAGDSGGSSGGGSSGSGNNDDDEASVSLEQTNENQFWSKIESELNSLRAGSNNTEERIVFDRFSGTVMVTASRRTHEVFSRFINSLNGRIGQQVEILGKIVEVTLNDQNKLGVDWTQAAVSIGGFKFGGAGSTLTGMNSSNGFELGADTVTGVITGSKTALLIEALAQQGSLNTVTAPRLVTLNNQTAYIKDAEDRPYFQRNSSTTVTPTDSSSNVTETASYSINSISIGTIVAITPHVSDNGDITLDITPAITRLSGEVSSPDGYSKAPSVNVKQTSTIIRLRSGETAIIGGIVSDVESRSTRSIPGLGSLPIIGRAFRSENSYKNKTELVILVTPRILNPGSSLTAAGLQSAERASRGMRRSVQSSGNIPRNSSHATHPVEAISLFD